MEYVGDYIDARGIWPIYIRGCAGIVLEGKKRDITLEDARIVAAALGF